MIGTRAFSDILDPKTGKILVKKGKKYTKVSIKKMKEAGLESIPLELEELVGKVVAEDIFDEKTGEVLSLANESLTEAKIQELYAAGIKSLKVLYIDMINYGDQMRNTLLLDKTDTSEEALIRIFERLRPGEPPTEEAASQLLNSLFFDKDKYDLSKVGRMKINYKFNM